MQTSTYLKGNLPRVTLICFTANAAGVAGDVVDGVDAVACMINENQVRFFPLMFPPRHIVTWSGR